MALLVSHAANQTHEWNAASEVRPMMSAVVKDVMSTHPVSVTRDASFKELAARLFELGVSGFPVVDNDGKVIGVVSEADMLAKEALQGGHHGLRGMIAAMAHRTERRKAGGVTAGDLMTSPAVTVAAEDTVENAAALMYDRGLKRLPVVDGAGRLVGIISRVDVLAVFDRLDEEIREEIISQVIPPLSEPSWYSVIVKDGVVTVEGTPETVSIGHEVLRRVRHVQGVVAVHDRLVYPVPPIVAAPGPYF
jgi:CBS domain-containing protein